MQRRESAREIDFISTPLCKFYPTPQDAENGALIAGLLAGALAVIVRVIYATHDSATMNVARRYCRFVCVQLISFYTKFTICSLFMAVSLCMCVRACLCAP